MLYLDATAIDTWLLCRESYRQRYIENRELSDPNIHLAMGHAIHTAVEWWHKGESYEQVLYRAAVEMEKAGSAFEGRLRPDIEIKWRSLSQDLPEVVATYCDGVEPCGEGGWYCSSCGKVVGTVSGGPKCFTCGGEVTWREGGEIEQEWSLPFVQHLVDYEPDGRHLYDKPLATLCGKIDRYANGVLTDVKTASEIGRTWKHDYRETLLRTFQFGLYDWYLRNRDAHNVALGGGIAPGQEKSPPPVSIKVECIVKPYRGKPARLEIFDLPEITVYRKRFDQQLAWVVSEIARYHEEYAGTKPWPMASQSTCQGKFSACPYIEPCNHGESPKILGKYKPREEHLELRRG